jgi:hypothetical protein
MIEQPLFDGGRDVKMRGLPMATYIYETIPRKKGQKPRRFEFVQKMSDAALTQIPRPASLCAASSWVAAATSCAARASSR